MKKFLDENFLLQMKQRSGFIMSMPKTCPSLIITITCRRMKWQKIKILKTLHRYGCMAIIINGGPCVPMGWMKNIVTGNKSDWEKFQRWAATVPYTLRNPLYHWTHLELQRYFDVHDILNADTAKKIYDECSAKLQTKEYQCKRTCWKK